jgi:nucleoside-diphosphate-sugar epimerase
MTVLVTGGTGFLGSHVVEQLARAGRPVRALVRKTSDTRFLKSLAGVELCEGSVEDAASVRDAARGVSYVVHAAGLVKARNSDEFMRTNRGGTENLLAAARDNATTRTASPPPSPTTARASSPPSGARSRRRATCRS